jgi:hypothetical protein
MTPFELNIPDEYLIRIGRINVAWGALEVMVDTALARLGGFDRVDPRGVVITAHLPWPLKMDILESLARLLENRHPSLRRFPKLKALLKAAQDGRNRTAHGSWHFKAGKVVKIRMTALGQLRSSNDTVPIPEPYETLNAITNAGRAVADIVFDAGTLPGAVLPDEPT